MAWSKNISKGASKNKLIESNNDLGGSTKSKPSVQSTKPSNIDITNTETIGSKSEYVTNERSNLLPLYSLHN